MTDKYYTPTIEEFHVGFEYEVQLSKEFDQWMPVQITPENHAMNFDRLDKLETTRVKYLDREDIESLGWEYINSKLYHSYKLNGKILYPLDDGDSLITNGKYGIAEETFFKGTIKNKSELKKLMQMLNIK